LPFERIGIWNLPQGPCLFSREPATETNAEVLRPFDPPNATSEIRAEQAGIRGLVCQASDGREPAIDRAWRKLTRFQVNSIARDDGFVKRESRFGAVPSDELVYCVSVSPLGFL
jgi:hypothetical protein